MNVKAVLFSVVLLCLGNDAFSQSNPASVTASIFYESFDAVCDIGGNDGIWSSSATQYATFAPDNEWTTSGTYYTAAQCIRLSGTSNSASYIEMKTGIPFLGSGYLEFKVGGFGSNSGKTVKYYYPYNGSHSSDKYTYSKGSFTTVRNEFSSNTSGFSYKLKIEKMKNDNSYFMLDDIILFKKDATASEQQNANKIVLTGDFTKADVEVLNKNISDNTKLTNIDATAATFPSDTKLTPGNKNCLIVAASGSNLTNNENIIVGGFCENLNLYENYNFHSDCNFTATNVSYDRKFSVESDGIAAGTVCLPFTLSKTSVPNLRFVGSFTGIKDKQIIFSKSDKITANEPFFMKASVSQPFLNLKSVNAEVKESTGCKKSHDTTNGTTNVCTITGIYTKYVDKIKNNTTNYALGYSGGVFGSLGDSVTVKPFRAVITAMNNSITGATTSVPYILDNDELTGTGSVMSDGDVKVDVYSAEGRMLLRGVDRTNAIRELDKGLYIIGKEKVFIK